MNYIVFDLEFNQAYDILKEPKPKVPAKCTFEILQLGALKLDEKFQKISSLNRLVKPDIYKNLNPFVKEMTGIRMEQLIDAKPFKVVYQEFIEFIKDDSAVLCVWGITDIKELYRNMEYHGISATSLPKKYINIQSYASKYLSCTKGTSIGLRNAVELLNISLKHAFHDAFNDAFYTTEVFRKIYSDQMVPQLYIPEKNRLRNSPNRVKKIIDTNNLMKQFEKMFHREMTAEEKDIIKLAYVMGMTNQFKISKNETT
jgi:inhibitor of KinA sporulation pathway (predicted exonuclease)